MPDITALGKTPLAQPVAGIITSTTTVSITLLDERHLRKSADIFLGGLLFPAAFACLSLGFLAWMIKRLGDMNTRTAPGNGAHEDQHPETEPETTEPPATRRLSDSLEFDIQEIHDSADEILAGSPNETRPVEAPSIEEPPIEEPLVEEQSKDSDQPGKRHRPEKSSTSHQPRKRPTMNAIGYRQKPTDYDTLRFSSDSESEASAVQAGAADGSSNKSEDKEPTAEYYLELELQRIERQRDMILQQLETLRKLHDIERYGGGEYQAEGSQKEKPQQVESKGKEAEENEAKGKEAEKGVQHKSAGEDKMDVTE